MPRNIPSMNWHQKGSLALKTCLIMRGFLSGKDSAIPLHKTLMHHPYNDEPMADTNQDDTEKLRDAADDAREAGEEQGDAFDKMADAKENLDDAMDKEND